MVDGDVNEELAVFAVNGIDEFDELFQRRGFPVELRQFGVDRCEIQRRIGTAETAHPPVNGWSRIDREQVKNAALHAVEDMIQFADESAESAGGGNDTVAAAVQFIFRCGAFRAECAVG